MASPFAMGCSGNVIGQLAATAGRRPDGEPIAPPALHEIKDLVGDIWSHLVFDEEFQLPDPLYILCILWLIQSQPQTGTSSAEAFEDHPQTLARVLAEKLPKLLPRLLGNLHRPLPC